MKKILVANQKGGVGKSLIADELAFSFERSGIPFCFFDLDNQGGTLHQTIQRSDATAVILDTPGALQRQMREWIRDADVVVIPTRTTSRDIAPLLRMKEIVQINAPKVPVIYVLNGWNRWRASKDFLDWFNEERGTMGEIVTLPQSEKFIQAGAARISVVSYDRRSKASTAMLHVINRIRMAAGFPNDDG